MMVCLDFGTTEFRSLRRHSACLTGRKSPAVYVSLPTDATDQNLLKQMRIPVIRSDDSLVVLGAAASDLAKSMRIPCVPLLIDGLVPTNDPLGRQLISTVLDSILPAPGDATPCGLISRSAVDFEQTTDLQLFAQLLLLKGYTPVLATSASAVVFAELGNDQFTGIVLDWGASGASLGAYRLGETLVESNLVNGGNLIDERIATVRQRFSWDREGHRYLDTQAIEAWKKSATIRIDHPRSDDEKLLAEIYREQLMIILLRFRAAINASPAAWLYSSPVKMVCSGGCTRVGGFLTLLAGLVQELDLPVSLSEIEICAPDSFRSARGAMIQMELDRLTENAVGAA
jgi:hypothetical protein